MATRGRKLARKFAWTFALILTVLLALAACNQQQNIRDYFDARSFTPSTEIIEVIDRIDLTPSGERIFLATHPQIQRSDVFNQHCRQGDHAHSGHLLGCFTEGSIHLYDVTDDRLGTVVEVTAVHELLHAAYARLSQRDRENLARQLTQYYEERIADDPELEERMAVYSHLSASQFANELHSIFATEIDELPDWLEGHYARWLNNRAEILSLFHEYRDVFKAVEQEAVELKAELDEMYTAIEEDTAAYTRAVETFNADWQVFVARNQAYEFSGNAALFNRLKAEFEGRRQQLDAWKLSLQDSIAQYEELRTRLEGLGELSTELNRQIDSRILTAP